MNVRDLGKLIVAKGLKKVAQSAKKSPNPVTLVPSFEGYEWRPKLLI